jgi:hypothetical protein
MRERIAMKLIETVNSAYSVRVSKRAIRSWPRKRNPYPSTFKANAETVPRIRRLPVDGWIIEIDAADSLMMPKDLEALVMSITVKEVS